ncbi:dTDP-glucose 4,6-dehydratase [Thermogladius sp. 4427co]|uniref:dTDP-glucose 4,6-dehydratase n=1 Tax=Thermogladius sp. 4427co TaxID=3450718 RepID=UPI003F7B2217
MRVLVTGGAGFIGSNFVRHIVNEYGWETIVYDKLTYAGRIENLRDVLDRIKFVRGDIADEESFTRMVRDFQPDVIVNFAAETHVDRSINEPAPFIKTNIVGVFTILETMRRIGYDILLLHVSTDEVYGDLWGTSRESSEEDALNPSSPYSASKASGDLLIKAYGRTYGLKYRIVRPCNNYGPYQHPEKLIPRSIIRILYNKPPVLYGDGSQVRDWLYVEDTAKAITLVIEKGSDREIYNVCGNMYATVREIVEKILEAMGKPKSFIVYGKPRPGEDRRYAMVCAKIRELGWKPLVGLETGLRLTVKWYLENEWWWKPLVDERYVLADHPW